MKNKIVLGLLSVTAVVYLVKWLMGVSFLKDEWYYWLIAVDLIAVFIKILEYNFMFRRTVMFACVVIIVMSVMAGSSSKARYNYMYSSDSSVRLVLKEYTKGVRDDGYLGVYKQTLGLFKKRLGKDLYVKGGHPLMTGEMAFREHQMFGGQNTYAIGKLAFEWVNQTTLEIDYQDIESLEEQDRHRAQLSVKVK
ncbi:MAG: hypothetical protein ACRCTE_12510 [Cellulosilyticaceae bacterium]